jgi:hypothetical protein
VKALLAILTTIPDASSIVASKLTPPLPIRSRIDHHYSRVPAARTARKLHQSRVSMVVFASPSEQQIRPSLPVRQIVPLEAVDGLSLDPWTDSRRSAR